MKKRMLLISILIGLIVVFNPTNLSIDQVKTVSSFEEKLHLSFEGSNQNNVVDSSQGLVGSLIGNAIKCYKGIEGKKLYLDGDYDHARVYNIGMTFSHVSTFTIAAWICPSATGLRVLVGHKYSTSYVFGLNNDKLFLRMDDTSTDSTAGIPQNQWTHVAVVYNPYGQYHAYFYINGHSAGHGYCYNGFSAVDDVFIGHQIRKDVTWIDDFQGSIDEVRVFNGAVPDKKIRELSVVEKMHLTLENENGNTVVDHSSSGYNNHGSLYNAQRIKIGGLGTFLSLNGNNNYATFSNLDFKLDHQSTFTFVAWVCPTQYGSKRVVIGQRVCQQVCFGIYDDGKLFLYMDDKLAASDGVVPLNQWSHIAVIYNPYGDYQAYFYINGELSGHYNCYNDLTAVDSLFIGHQARHTCDWTKSFKDFVGMIDEVQIFKGALLDEDSTHLNLDLPYSIKIDFDLPCTIKGHIFPDTNGDSTPLYHEYIDVRRTDTNEFITGTYTDVFGYYEVSFNLPARDTEVRVKTRFKNTQVDIPIPPNRIIIQNFYPDFGKYGFDGYMINVPRAHDFLNQEGINRPGEGVTVALVGTGIDPHEDLMYTPDGQLRTITYIDVNRVSFFNIVVKKHIIDSIDKWNDITVHEDPFGDYFHVEGVYDGASYFGNVFGHETGVLGSLLKVAPYINVIIVDVLDEGTTIFEPTFKEALMYLCDEITAGNLSPDIISLSLGDQVFSDREKTYFQIFKNEDILTIASSGNKALFTSGVAYPAGYPEVLGVGGIETTGIKIGDRNANSQYGPSLDVVAPFHSYTTTCVDLNNNGIIDDYTIESGTSFSAPLVAGEAALMYQYYKWKYNNLPTSNCVTYFGNTIVVSCDLGGYNTNPYDKDPTYDRQSDEYGWGIVDCWEALQAI